MKEVNFYDVIKCFKEGDKECLMEILERFDPLLIKYSALLGYEDAKQDLILQLISALKKVNFKKCDHVQARIVKYIHTVVRFEYIRLSKKKNRQSLYELTFDDDYSSGYEQDFDSAMFFVQLIDMLPKKQGEVIYLLFVKHLKEVEVAKVLGITRQAVNNNKKRAFSTIKEKMDMKCLMC